MRIVLLTQWFDPEPTFKGLLFAQELQRRGHEVQVITGFPNYPGGKVYDGYRIRPLERVVIDGVVVVRSALFPSHDSSPMRRVLNYASFALSSSVATLLIRRPDVAYVYHPPATIGLPALVLKALRGVPFVYDVQDLWPDTLEATGMIRNRHALAAVGRWMKLVYRAAAGVTVLSDGFKEAIRSRGAGPDQLTVIGNWAEENRLRLAHPGAARARELGFEGRFNIVFAGAMGPAQGLTSVLDAAELLTKETDVQLVLVGGGIGADDLIAEASRRHLKNIRFLSRRPIDEIGEILALADGLLVHLRDDPLFEITIPSKTQVYLLAGRPILMGVRGDAARLVDEAGAGLVFEPDRPAKMAEAILKLRDMSPTKRAQMGLDGSAYYRDHLSLERGVDRFEEAFARAVLAKPRVDAVQRLIDMIVSAVGLAVLALPMAILALLVRRKLGRPVLYTQVRPGQHGRRFKLVKFRTMTNERNGDGELLPDGQRLTRFGRLLRSSSLDELPELWNVLRGDMSLVGPRPLLERYSAYFTDEERLRTVVRPGISGWAQVNGRNSSSWTHRLGMDVWYVRNRSFRLNAKILVQTLGRVFNRSGVIVDPGAAMLDLDDERRAWDLH